MKEIINSEKIFFFLLIICSFGIGLQSDIYKYAIIALLLQWLLSLDFSNKFQKLKQNKFALLLIFFYVFYAISFFWSDNISIALTDLLLKIPILLFPLILASSQPLNKHQINKILLVFCISSLFVNFYALGNACLNYLETADIRKFVYWHLSINMHSAYQAMFTCFSIVLIIYLNLKDKFVNNWAMYCYVFFQMILILLLSSRMQILIMVVLIPFYFIVKYYKTKKLYLGIIYTVAIFSFAYLLIAQSSPLNYRYTKTVKYVNDIGGDNNNSDPRQFIWAEGLKVIKENWLFGVGSGDAKAKLIEKFSAQILEKPFLNRIIDSTSVAFKGNKKLMATIYETSKKNRISLAEQIIISANKKLEAKNYRYNRFIQRAFNYHNQYLQSFAAIGLFGVILLLILLVIPGVQFLIKKKYLEVVFLFIVGSCFLTESMFERQAGVAFISFFYTLLIILKPNNQHKPS